MKGETNTIKEKNPYKYNGESTHISPHSKSLLNTDNQQLTNNKKVYIESYGCQMNFADSEVVASIIENEGYNSTHDVNDADLILLNTCSIRDKAEQTVRKRLKAFNKLKKENKYLKVGVLGCMAERLKTKFLEEEKIVDLVVGPDAYKDLPNLIQEINEGNSAVNVILSTDETYGDINPVRLSSNGVSAFVSITRGCDNMCTFCVVPYTRGRERSRNPESIVNECKDLFSNGFREVTLLGQNVDSYLWFGGGPKKNFKNLSKEQKYNSKNFANLLETVAKVNEKLRIRFSTSNPQDMTDDVIDVMSKYKNICNYIHLPVQSGSSRILELMNRGYNREEYISLVDKIKNKIPDCAISMDMITGFCSETEEDHKETLSLMDYVKYDFGYMFKYSERPNTPAARMEDNIDEKTKQRRLAEVIEKQQAHSLLHMQEKLGYTYEVLIEGNSKKSDNHFYGRTTYNSAVVFEKGTHKIGEYVMVKIEDCTSATLKGTVL